jgi:hypothetical protein
MGNRTATRRKSQAETQMKEACEVFNISPYRISPRIISMILLAIYRSGHSDVLRGARDAATSKQSSLTWPKDRASTKGISRNEARSNWRSFSSEQR